MLIKNASSLLGQELDYAQKVDIQVHNGVFKRIQSEIRPNPNDDVIDGGGLLVLPGFINAHTHIGDSIGKDVTLDSSADKKIHPVFGAKSKILKHTRNENLENFMRNSCYSMMQKGITTFVDFREGGLNGVMMLENALRDVPIRSVVLGRIESYNTNSEIKKNVPFPKEKNGELLSMLKRCDGIGISGANENSASVLNYYSKTAKIRAIHSAETAQSTSKSKKITGRSETVRALSMRPHFLVHMTYASKSDLRKTAQKTRGIVVCPRANSSLAEGIPDVELMRKAGCIVGLGTDNVMVNSPDMFREMDFLWKVTMGIHRKRIDPKEILKMATVNGGKILKKNMGTIGIGKLADCIFIDKHSLDLEPMHNPYAAVVHRASESAIRAVMIGGRIVHGGL